MKMNMILCMSLLSVVSLSAMEVNVPEERFAMTGRFLTIQKRMEELRQELGIVRESDESKKGKETSEREIHQELFRLGLSVELQKVKTITQKDIEYLSVLPYLQQIAKNKI